MTFPIPRKPPDPEEREKLRERALERIRSMEGMKEELISDILKEAQENEITTAKGENRLPWIASSLLYFLSCHLT